MRVNVRLWRRIPSSYRQKLVSAAAHQNVLKWHEKSLHALAVRVSS